MPGLTTAGQLITVTGSGYAAGASITIGSYAGPVTPGHAVAGPTGSFSITVRVPAKGAHTLVATGIGGNGRARYLEARTTTR